MSPDAGITLTVVVARNHGETCEHFIGVDGAFNYLHPMCAFYGKSWGRKVDYSPDFLSSSDSSAIKLRLALISDH